MQILIDYIHMHLGSTIGTIIIFFLSCIEISKIKFNPISAILKFIGKACNSTLYEKMDALEKQQNELSDKFEKTYDAMQERFKEIDNQMETRFEDVGQRFDGMSDRLQTYKDQLDYSVAMTSRYRLIRAAENVIDGSGVSKDRLEVLLNDDLKVYQTYCNTHPEYINHKGQRSVKILLDYESEVQQYERQNNEAVNS